jgi:hypothetical protein
MCLTSTIPVINSTHVCNVSCNFKVRIMGYSLRFCMWVCVISVETTRDFHVFTNVAVFMFDIVPFKGWSRHKSADLYS